MGHARVALEPKTRPGELCAGWNGRETHLAGEKVDRALSDCISVAFARFFVDRLTVVVDDLVVFAVSPENGNVTRGRARQLPSAMFDLVGPPSRLCVLTSWIL